MFFSIGSSCIDYELSVISSFIDSYLFLTKIFPLTLFLCLGLLTLTFAVVCYFFSYGLDDYVFLMDYSN